MEIVAPFIGREPTLGIHKVAPRYNTTDNLWRQGSRNVNWLSGVHVAQISCSPVRVHAPAPCGGPCCDLTADPCLDVLPDHVEFRPFKIRKGLCLPGSCAANPSILTNLEADFNAYHPIALASAWFNGIGTNPGVRTVATDLSGGVATSVADGIGALLEYRSLLGVGGGWLVHAVRAMPVVGQVLAGMVDGYGTSPFNAVVPDFGVTNVAPDGTPADPGFAWLYVTGPAVTAIVSEATVLTSTPDTATPYLDAETGCYQPLVEHVGIVAFNGCGTAAVLVDLREKGC